MLQYFFFLHVAKNNFLRAYIYENLTENMIDSRTLEKIETIDERSWGVIYKELVRFAGFKLAKAGFEIRTEKDSVDAEHFATIAIEKVLDGTRAWDFDRYPDITIHLKGIVKSLISSHFKSSNRSVVEAGRETDITPFAGTDDENFEELEINDSNGFAESPEEIIISHEYWEQIEKAFGSNKDEYVIFFEWIDGSPPRVISDTLEISVKEVNNAIKRGVRIVKTLFKKKS